MKVLCSPWLAPVLLLLVPNIGLAQSNMDARVQKLEEAVVALERRVAALESELHNQRSVTGVPAGVASWRKLQKGISRSDVEQILGSPTRVNEYGPYTVWYYESTSGTGRVQFNGRTQTVESWSEP